MRPALACALVLLGGCIGSELIATHVQPGGMVTGQIAGGAKVSCTALADGTQDPFQLSGFSAFLTIGLIADRDTRRGPAAADLAQPGGAIEGDLTPGSRTPPELQAGPGRRLA